MFHFSSSLRPRARAGTAGLAALAISALAAMAAGPVQARPICDGPCPSPRPSSNCHVDTTHSPPRYYGCPLVTVEQNASQYSTPFFNAAFHTALRATTYVALCEAYSNSRGPYSNPWWTKLHSGLWVNDGYLRNGHTRKMGIGDCVAPRNDDGGVAGGPISAKRCSPARHGGSSSVSRTARRDPMGATTVMTARAMSRWSGT